MKIKKLDILRVKMPLLKPFVTSFGEIKDREIVIVKIYDENGQFGFGEAPVLTLPLYNPETPDSVISILEKVIFPIIKNKEIKDPQELDSLLEFIKGNDFAKSSVIMAYYDLLGKLKNKRLVDILGGKKKKLTISATISIHKTIADALDETEEYIKSGITFLKLKIKLGYDLTYVKAILKKFSNVQLMLDANSSYILNSKTLRTFKSLDDLNLYCIEQPLQSFDIIDHAKLQRKIKTKIALDESIESTYDIEKALELGSCKLVNIKIARVGGINQAIKINQICKKNNIKTWVGGMIESPVGFYANLALSTLDNFDYPIDFLGALTYMKDYQKLYKTLPYEISGNYLTPKLEKPGLGLDLSWDFFNKHIVEKITVK